MEHELVHEALHGVWSSALLPRLLEAWRSERTSDLADVIEALGLALDREVCPLRKLEDLDAWAAHYRHAPTAALDALVDAAISTFDLWKDEAPAPGSPAQGTSWAAKDALAARWWRALAGAVETLRSELPDPRIGRAMVAMLRSPSDHWFRVDQVAHGVVSFESSDSRPSFADHALELMELHADAGTAARLEGCASLIAIECDCNGGEMVGRLRALAASLRTRFPVDRALPPGLGATLRNRHLVSPRER